MSRTRKDGKAARRKMWDTVGYRHRGASAGVKAEARQKRRKTKDISNPRVLKIASANPYNYF